MSGHFGVVSRCKLVLGVIAGLAVASSFDARADRVSLPPETTAISRIALGSCSFQSEPQPVFRALVEKQPDLYISLGDAIYADYDLDAKQAYDVSPESLRREWQVLADSPDWQYLASRVPVIATWDNHDYGHHSAGREFPLKRESKALFLDFFGEPADSPRRQREGIYTAYEFGPEGRRLQIILLDTRSFKSSPLLADRPEDSSGSLGKYAPLDDPGATLLGDAQWQWLSAQLAKPADLRLIVSSGQVIADQKGMDEWGNYPQERERLFRLIASVGADRVLLLSGNVHFSEVSITALESKPLLDFTSSGLTHVDVDYALVSNPYRVAGPVVVESFGLVEIDWDRPGVYGLTLSAITAQGLTAMQYRFGVLSEGSGPPTRLERVQVPTDNTRLDVKPGPFKRSEVRPYGQKPEDRYGKDFPN